MLSVQPDSQFNSSTKIHPS